MRKYPQAPLSVYAVWTKKLYPDRRSQWDAGGLTDSRVKHFWDPQDVTGTWLATKLQRYEGRDWDAFALFGPGAVWDNAPGRLISSGSTVIATRDRLRHGIEPLLKAPLKAGQSASALE